MKLKSSWGCRIESPLDVFLGLNQAGFWVSLSSTKSVEGILVLEPSPELVCIFLVKISPVEVVPPLYFVLAKYVEYMYIPFSIILEYDL